MRRRKEQQRVDPYMQDVPYDIIRNDQGKVDSNCVFSKPNIKTARKRLSSH